MVGVVVGLVLRALRPAVAAAGLAPRGAAYYAYPAVVIAVGIGLLALDIAAAPREIAALARGRWLPPVIAAALTYAAAVVVLRRVPGAIVSRPPR